VCVLLKRRCQLRFPSTEIKLVFEALVSPEMAVTLPATTNCREVVVDDSSSRDSVVTDEDTNRHALSSLFSRLREFVICFIIKLDDCILLLLSAIYAMLIREHAAICRCWYLSSLWCSVYCVIVF